VVIEDTLRAPLLPIFLFCLATRSTWEEPAAPRHGGYIRLRQTVLYTQRLPICGEPRTRSEAEEFPPPPALLPIPSRSSGVSIAGSQKVVYDEISDVTTQSLAGRKVEEKMHTGKDAAQRCFFCGSRKACE
jgi:hypothetical protein